MPKKFSEETLVQSVRLTKDQMERLQAIARRTGVEVAQLIRMACEALVKYVEAHDGALHLPLDFTRFWHEVERAGYRSGLHSLNDADDTDQSVTPLPPPGHEPTSYRKALGRKPKGA